MSKVPVIPSRLAIAAVLRASEARRELVDNLRRLLAEQTEDPLVRASREHLADLYAYCNQPYPEVAETWRDMLPFDWRRRVRTEVSIGSAAGLCADS
jgi:hypothetical protein